MRKRRILIVTADYPPPLGGIQFFTYELEKELIANSYNVKVLNFDGRNTNTYKYLHFRDFFYTPATKNQSFPLIRILNPLNLLKTSGGYRDFVYKNMIYRVTNQTIKIFKPDIVHIMKNELYSAIYSCNNPTIISCHSSTGDIQDKYHIKYVLQRATKIHCVSKFVMKLVNNITIRNSKDIHVIPNFIDLSVYKNSRLKRKNRLITIARLQSGKNIETLLKAYALLPQKYKNQYDYVIIGNGNKLNDLSQLANKLNLPKVVFTGEITNVNQKIDLLSSSRIFLLCPSDKLGPAETFGIVYLEAQALGIPIISSKSGGIPEAVGHAGIYVSDELDPKEIAEKIESLIKNRKLYAELIRNSQKRIKKFDKKVWFSKIIDMYEEAILDYKKRN